MNRAEATATTDTSLAGGIGPGKAQRHQDLMMGDPDLELLRSGEDTAWRDLSRVFRTWAGRFQSGRVQEVIRAVEARRGNEASVTELDLGLDDWASADLRQPVTL